MNPQTIKEGSQKQTKKRTSTIQIQVNRLLKFPTSNKYINQSQHHQTRKDQLQQTVSTDPQTYQSFSHDLNQPILNKEKKQVKSFEEMYFQKMKELRGKCNTLQLPNHLHKSNPSNKLGIDQNRPQSCKSGSNLHNFVCKNHCKVVKTVKYPRSTKNSKGHQNKQNEACNHDCHQKSITNNHKIFEGGKHIFSDQFFKKNKNQIVENNPSRNIQEDPLSLLHINLLQHNTHKTIQSSIENDMKEGFFKNKTKKVLKLKKTNDRKSSKSFQKLIEGSSQDLLKFQQSKEIKPKLENQNKSFNLSITSSQDEKPPNELELQIDFVVEHTIDHMSHEHVWGGTQCFFSKEEFFLILKQLRLTTQKDSQIHQYLVKLWEHLGGDIYGGVVKSNFKKLLKIIFEREQTRDEETIECQMLERGPKMLDSYVDRSSLKLLSISTVQKKNLVKFYSPLRRIKINNIIPQNDQAFEKKCEDINPQQLNILAENQDFISETHVMQSPEKQNQKKVVSSSWMASQVVQHNPSQRILSQRQQCSNQQLQNLIDLQSKSETSAINDLSPPFSIQKNTDKIEVLALNNNYVTDFSPKLSSQQYEPFRSMVLQKQENYNQITGFEDRTYEKKLGRPLLSVDVNLSQGRSQKLIVYQNQTPYEVSLELKAKYNMEEDLRQKFQQMLEYNLKTLLYRIEQVSEELFEDSLQY